MKKYNTVINIILFVAIVILYVLHFTSGKNTSPVVTHHASDTLQSPASGVVYVNIDTLLSRYDMYHDFEDRFNEKQQSSEAKLDSRSKEWQKRVTNYQDMVKKGLITRSKAAEMEQQLSKEQQDLVQLKDDLGNQLVEQQQVMNRQILYSIMDYLEKFNTSHQYKYILSNSVGGGLLYADTQLDITPEVIEGINQYYAGIRDSVLEANK